MFWMNSKHLKTEKSSRKLFATNGKYYLMRSCTEALAFQMYNKMESPNFKCFQFK